MSNPTASFFEALGRRGHEPLLEEATGAIRFDLDHEQGVDHWFVMIDRGDVRVSRDEGEADCVLHSTRANFDRIVDGTTNIYSAWVRNDIRVEGDLRPAALIQRIMPGPSGAHHPREFAQARRRPA
ncbi:SCP2 sterol-binding domain-containing protein [Micromonospora purpureochromogenes]|uniref:SCP2 sterol-binding domain-containing protein n=1 Tax=Micromonospora purpureochromogenes TaxID=47872 RepID=UPI0033C87D54